MNSEESRLRTFLNWPENAPVDSKRIARAGFYYMGQGLEVQCFRCGSRISDWNYGDKVMAKHKALDPRCPFVQNPTNSGNIPLVIARLSLTSPTEQTEVKKKQEDRVFFYDEKARLESFATWPFLHVPPARLAKSGFFYLQDNAKVRCAYCGGVIEDWREGDEPDLVHIERFPNCSYVKEIIDKGVLVKSGSLTFQDTCDGDNETFRALGIQSHRIPKTPRYSTYESRIRTFCQWPESCAQTPSDLAQAGFYFKGPGDEVRCFHCDGGLHHWQKVDVPWVEHARWFGECGFLALVKGPEYIEDVRKSFPARLTKEEENVLSKIPKSSVRNTVTEEQLREFMSSQVAIMALQVGIEASRVKSAIRHKLETTGLPFENADNLIVAALEVQNEENQSMDEEYWSIPTNSPVPRVRAIMPRLEIYNSTASDESEDEEEQICNEERRKNNSQVIQEVKIEEDIKPKENQEISLEEENRKLREARLCKICMDIEVGVVFLPCGHLVTCANCAHSLKDCPLCRQLIKATVRTFLC
ncbi:putative inhibitor of apoptosis isoform X1 [Cimex lectularius]|uniref:RING-type domain-containing protein n=1 Tax=Cimex lectularius TaxID=79782 RepID=A0A8I6S7S7_CIMLE|nr:putative inhibitor of apoptosis isoform X1 [Cimex lectularius]